MTKINVDLSHWAKTEMSKYLKNQYFQRLTAKVKDVLSVLADGDAIEYRRLYLVIHALRYGGNNQLRNVLNQLRRDGLVYAKYQNTGKRGRRALLVVKGPSPTEDSKATESKD
jgi:hypothetical protein